MNKVKFFAVFLAITVLFMLSSKMCVLKATTMENSASFSANAVVSEKEISYTITVSENSGICGLTLNVIYDPTEVKLINHKEGSLISNGITKCNADKPGKVILSYISTEPVVKSGEIMLASFEPITSDCKELNITYEISECIDINCDEIPVTPHTVTATNPIYKKPETLTSKDGSGSKATSEKTETTTSKDDNSAKSENPSSYDDKDNSDLQTLKDKTEETFKGEEMSSVEDKATPTGNKSQSDFRIPILSGVGILVFVAVVCIYILKIRRKKK
ncbi:MAG: hypothetical protein IJT84_07995 [Clostridia bacterium]|nr:hypothetical protein [Clostridia bacterium]